MESSEASGELEAAMNRIAEGIERRSEQIVKLVSALFYPVFVMVVATMVTLFLVYGVIPKFATFIERKGGNLPASTQFLMDLSKVKGAHPTINKIDSNINFFILVLD